METENDAQKSKPKMVKVSTVLKWVLVVAVVLVGACYGGYRYYAKTTNAKICDAIFAAGFHPKTTLARDVDEDDYDLYDRAVEFIYNDNLDEAARILEQLYNDADFDMKIEYGTSLAYVYVKQHEVEKARKLIGKLIKMSRKLYGSVPDELTVLLEALEGSYFV